MEDTASERAVLASIIQFGYDAYVEVSDIIEPNCFTNETNEVIWNILHNLYSKDEKVKLDYTRFLVSAREIGVEEFIKESDNKKYLKALNQFNVELSNTRFLAKNLLKTKIISDLKVCVEKSSANLDTLTGNESLEDIISSAESPITEYVSNIGNSDDKPLDLRDNTQALIDYFINDPRDICGIPTGFSTIDDLTGGMLRRGSVSVICARPGAGKTSMLMNIGTHISDNNKLNIPVLLCDLEMSPEMLCPRLIASLSDVPITEIERGKIKNNPVKFGRVQEAVKRFSNFNFHYKNVNGSEFDEIISYIRRWVRKYVGVDKTTGVANDCLVIIDYIKLMSMDSLSKNLMETQVLGGIMQKLHTLAGTLNIPILSAIQENRDGAVATSDRVNWLASTIIMLKMKTPEELANDAVGMGNRKIEFEKTRFGPGMNIPKNDYVCVAINLDTNKVKELGLRSNLKDDSGAT